MARYTTITKLVAEGLDRDYLKALVKRPDADFCWKQNPELKNSPYVIDLDRLEEFFAKQGRQNAAINKSRQRYV